jgi:hypothetical protein
MALQGTPENLGALDAKPDAIILNGGDGCLGNARQLGQFILAVPLQLSNNAKGLPRRYVDALSSWTKVIHPMLSDSHAA